jgi:3-hydroxyacyl-CoA dehydrogenase
MKTTLIGSGRSWAISFARAGHQVRLWDRGPAAPQAAIDFARNKPPDAIIVSSTSAILPSKFMEHVAGRTRCLVCHSCLVTSLRNARPGATGG